MLISLWMAFFPLGHWVGPRKPRKGRKEEEEREGSGRAEPKMLRAAKLQRVLGAEC